MEISDSTETGLLSPERLKDDSGPPFPQDLSTGTNEHTAAPMPPSAQTLKDSQFIKKFAGRHAITHNGVDAVYLAIELRDSRRQTIDDANIKTTLSALIRRLGHYGIDARIGRHGRNLWLRDAEVECGSMEHAGDDEMDNLARKEEGVTSIFNQRQVTPEQRAAAAARAGFIPSHVVSLVVPTQGRATAEISVNVDRIYKEMKAETE